MSTMVCERPIFFEQTRGHAESFNHLPIDSKMERRHDDYDSADQEACQFAA